MINTRVSSNVLASRIASDIVKQQSELAKLQTHISTGKRVNRPSDDPVESARILQLKEAVGKLDQYQRNASTAEAQLTLGETTLDGVSNILMRVRELSLSANSGVTDDATRAAHASEIKLALGELYDLANAKDSFGNYLFSGTSGKILPFSGTPPVQYGGSDDGMEVDVGLGRKIQTVDPGTDVFMRIRKGNGTFQTQSDASNTGTGTISEGTLVTSAAYEPNNFEIQFTSSTSYDIQDTTTGSTVVTGAVFGSEDSIDFNGIRTSITGAPQAGDVFHVSPSSYQDLFTTISELSNALERPQTTEAERANMRQSISTFLSDIDQSMAHINTVRSSMGTRLNSLERSQQENEDIRLQLESTRSKAEDIDVADAITKLQNKVTSLEILQKTFTRIESLSLFNYM